MRSCNNSSTRIVFLERAGKQQTNKPRRMTATVFALLAIALICAGAAIVSHARTIKSTSHDHANSPGEQSGVEFSELEHGGLGL